MFFSDNILSNVSFSSLSFMWSMDLDFARKSSDQEFWIHKIVSIIAARGVYLLRIWSFMNNHKFD